MMWGHGDVLFTHQEEHQQIRCSRICLSMGTFFRFFKLEYALKRTGARKVWCHGAGPTLPAHTLAILAERYAKAARLQFQAL